MSKLGVVWWLAEGLLTRIGCWIGRRVRAGCRGVSTRCCLIRCRIIVCILHVIFVLREDSDQELGLFIRFKSGRDDQVVARRQLEAAAHLKT